MKRLLLLVIALVCGARSASAQQGLQAYVVTGTGAQARIVLTGSTIVLHQLTWNVTGTVSGCTVALDTSADGVSWSAGNAIAGQTCTSNGQSSLSASAPFNFVRVNVTAFSGTGSVVVTWSGYVASPNGVVPAGTTVSGSDITFPGNVTPKKLDNIRIADQFCAVAGVLNETCINNAILNFGVAPACGTIILPWGEVDISNTVGGSNLSTRKGCVLEGQGASQSSSSVGTYLKWVGAANGTIVDLHSCWNCVIEHASMDGATTAGYGLKISSVATDDISVQNEGHDLSFNNITGTPGISVYVGSATGYEVENAKLDGINIRTTNTAFYQEGAATTDIQYNHFTVTTYATACLNMTNGTATANAGSCGSPGGSASGVIVVGNAMQIFAGKGLDIGGTTTTPSLNALGVLNTLGPTIGISDSGLSAGVGGLIVNYTQNGALTLERNTWGGTAGTLTINPIGNIGSGFFGSVRLVGNIWGNSVINATGVNYTVTSDDDTAGATFYTGAATQGGNPLKIYDQAALQLLGGSLGFKDSSDQFYFAQSGFGLQLHRDAGIGAQFYVGSTAALDGSTDFEVPQMIANQYTFIDRTASNPGLFSSGTTVQARLGNNSADAPISASNGTFSGAVSGATYKTATNCSSSASPAVCGSAAAGSVAVPTGVTPTLVVNTTAVTANSQILFTPDESLGTKLGVTCNSTIAQVAIEPIVTARTAATSFTIQYNTTITVNPICLSYHIFN